MNDEIMEQLGVILFKLSVLMRDVQRLKDRIESNDRNRVEANNSDSPPTPSQPSYGSAFFTALSAEDVPQQQSKFMQCPHN